MDVGSGAILVSLEIYSRRARLVRLQISDSARELSRDELDCIAGVPDKTSARVRGLVDRMPAGCNFRMHHHRRHEDRAGSDDQDER